MTVPPPQQDTQLLWDGGVPTSAAPSNFQLSSGELSPSLLALNHSLLKLGLQLLPLDPSKSLTSLGPKV